MQEGTQVRVKLVESRDKCSFVLESAIEKYGLPAPAEEHNQRLPDISVELELDACGRSKCGLKGFPAVHDGHWREWRHHQHEAAVQSALPNLLVFPK